MPYSMTVGNLGITFPTAGFSDANPDPELPDGLVFASGVYVSIDGVLTTEIDLSPVAPALIKMFGQEVLTDGMRTFAALLLRKAEEIENGNAESRSYLVTFGIEEEEH